MSASEIRAGHRYINTFGTVYLCHRIEGENVVCTLEGIRMKDLRMPIDSFARFMVRELPPEED